MSHPSTPRPGTTFDQRLVVLLAMLVLAGHVAAAAWFPRALWGLHSYRFLPAGALIGALALTLVAIIVSLRSRFDWRARAADAVPSARDRPGRVALLVLAAIVVFWAFRIGHALLGDARPLTQSLPLGESSHPRQPLTLLLHHVGYELARRLAGEGRPPAAVAFDAVAAGSILAGGVFVWVAWRLSRRLVSYRCADGADPRIAIPILALFLTQGYVLLFFGYVENYTYFTLALGWYLLEGLRFLDGRGPLIRSVIALIVAIGLNLSGLILLPSLAVLAAWGLRRREARRAVARDLVIGLVLALALDRALTALGSGYDSRQALRGMWYLVGRGQGGPGTHAYLLSPGHLRDVANVVLLIGPFAGALLLPLAVHRLIRGTRDRRLFFLLGAALPPLATCWLFAEPPLGFPRDWDLFAPYGVAYVAAGACCLVVGPLDHRALGRLVTVAATASIFHVAPWVAVNRSEALALERFKNLPRVRGREEYYVGHWYMTRGDLAQAREWFRRAVEVSPSNNAAQYYLGLFAMDERRYEEAASRFRISVTVRPSIPHYRLALVDALVLGGHPDAAVRELEWLVESDSTQARYWACYGVVLAGIGRSPESRHALERAARLAPEDSTLARLLARAGDPDAYRRAVDEDWDRLVVP